MSSFSFVQLGLLYLYPDVGIQQLLWRENGLDMPLSIWTYLCGARDDLSKPLHTLAFLFVLCLHTLDLLFCQFY